MSTQKVEIGPAVSSDLVRFAVAYNDALDRCTRTGGENIDEVMEFFAGDAPTQLLHGLYLAVLSGRLPSRPTAQSL